MLIKREKVEESAWHGGHEYRILHCRMARPAILLPRRAQAILLLYDRWPFRNIDRDVHGLFNELIAHIGKEIITHAWTKWGTQCRDNLVYEPMTDGWFLQWLWPDRQEVYHYMLEDSGQMRQCWTCCVRYFMIYCIPRNTHRHMHACQHNYVMDLCSFKSRFWVTFITKKLFLSEEQDCCCWCHS